MILFTYLAKRFLIWFLIVSLVMLTIIFLFEFSEFLRRGYGKISLNINVIIEMSLLKTPKTFEKLLPFIIFFSSSIVFFKLNYSNELVIIRNVGVSAWKFIIPILLVAIIISFLSLTLLNPYNAIFKKRLDILELFHFNKSKNYFNFFKKDLWFFTINQSDIHGVIFTKRIEYNPSALQKTIIFEQDFKGNFLRRFDAQAASLEKGKLNLHSVYISCNGSKLKFFKEFVYASYINPKVINFTQKIPRFFSFWSVTRFLLVLKSYDLQVFDYKFYWHSLMSQSFWIVLMVFLGSSCSLHTISQRRKVKFIFLVIIVNFFLYMFQKIFYSMGLAQNLSIILSTWLPIFITFIFGILFLLHSERH